MKNSIVTHEEIKQAINKINVFANKEEIQILLKKEIGYGYLYIQKLVDGLGFTRYDFMWCSKNWNSMNEEPDGILVF